MGISSAVPEDDVSTVPRSATQVVIYDDSRFSFAARLWWMLRYLWHEQVAILDGGIRAWTVAGLALSQEMPEAKAGAFNPSLQSDWVVDIETVRQRKDRKDIMLIDSRAPERWRGEVEPIDPIAGSIQILSMHFEKTSQQKQDILKVGMNSLTIGPRLSPQMGAWCITDKSIPDFLIRMNT